MNRVWGNGLLAISDLAGGKILLKFIELALR